MLIRIIKAFKSLIPCEWDPTNEQTTTLSNLIAYSDAHNEKINIDFERIFIEAINQKLSLNGVAFQRLLDIAFKENIKLNYIQKNAIRSWLDSADFDSYTSFLKSSGIKSERMLNGFQPVEKETSYKALQDIIKNDIQYSDILASVFSRFCFNLFSKDCVYSFFAEQETSITDFFEFMNTQITDFNDRSSALTIIDVSSDMFSTSYEYGCNLVLNSIKNSYRSLNNHCDMAIVIPPIVCNSIDYQWRLYADCVLFAEKHIKEKIDKPYFRWQKIGSQTTEYIPGIIPFNAEFDYAFQGFVYRDCFVIKNDNDTYSLLLIFEKNRRDERIVNCPACRTKYVQGNSYPILNVRSWECQNSLCPDRSKYNRGKRYAFMSLFRQKEMLNDDNIIPQSSISKWRLDCQKSATREEIFEMIIRHYSCFGDGINIVSKNRFDADLFGRKASTKEFSEPETSLLSNFKNASYFYRYLHFNDKMPERTIKWKKGKSAVFKGDALDVLRETRDEQFSGAVTSPPYYNAKSYSQWSNIYCYLYDMYNINKEVFRTLKKGGVYLFNIFDYFDNENNIALSAMGNKRMILGAYMIDMFERIGFTVIGNIIWNKGEIQGNRSFNQGNLTPYYQAPLNCWEHILILSKGKPDEKFECLHSCIQDIRPVIKNIRGKNVLGHEAPYPKEIPEILIRTMEETDIILDPFLGSGTTCVVANQYGINSVGIEKSDRYFELCKSIIKDCAEN